MRRADLRLLPVLVALVCVSLLLSTQGCTVKEPEEQPLLVQYYYENLCDTCDAEGKFLNGFEQYTGISRDTPNLKIEMYNVFKESDKEVFDETMTRLGVEQSRRRLPLLRIGDRIIPSDQIDDALKDHEFAATLPDTDDTVLVNGSVVFYFYVAGCEDCAKAKTDTIERLPDTMVVGAVDSAVQVRSIAVAGESGIALFRAYCKAFSVPEDQQLAPIVFVGYRYLQGSESIRELPALLEQGEGMHTPLLQAGVGSGELNLDDYSWASVFLTGLLNGLNPCAISMVLMLLSLLAIKKEWIFPAGLAFVIGKFMGFLILGVLLYNAVGALPLTALHTVIKVVLAVFAGVMVLMNINDFLAARSSNYRGIKLQLPTGLRKWNHRQIKRVAGLSSPVALVAGGALLGLLISGGEFLCTGQIYIAVILQVANSADKMMAAQALGTLAIYSLAFVLPLLVLVLLVGRGRHVFGISEFFRKNMMWIKLFNAVLFIIILVFVLIG